MIDDLAKALQQLKNGRFIIIYDGDEREGEADLVCHAKFATAEKIEKMRRDAGGLICVALSETTADRLKLPFFSDLIGKRFRISKMRCDKTAYGDKPAFSIPVNHKKVYTGITDSDRSLTIRKIWETTNRKNAHLEFFKNFYTPGHVFLLRGSGIKKRRGHTELSIELAERAHLAPTMVLCEMLGKGNALGKKKAKGYAKKNGFVFIEGKDIIMAIANHESNATV